MSKLLTEPRIPKAISEPKPRRKKLPKSDVPVEVKFKLLKESSKKKVDELFRIYKESPLHARVKYFNTGKGNFQFDRLVVFEFGEKDFEITKFKTTFGISTTNRIYSSQKKELSITYKKGKFYYFNNIRKTVRPLTYGLFVEFIQSTEGIYFGTNDTGWNLDDEEKDERNTGYEKSKVYSYFKNRFSWIRMLAEHNMSLGVNFNVLIAKKLYGGKDINRHVMRVPNNIAVLVLKSRAFKRLKDGTGKQIKQWYEILKILEHVDHLKE